MFPNIIIIAMLFLSLSLVHTLTLSLWREVSTNSYTSCLVSYLANVNVSLNSVLCLTWTQSQPRSDRVKPSYPVILTIIYLKNPYCRWKNWLCHYLLFHSVYYSLWIKSNVYLSELCHNSSGSWLTLLCRASKTRDTRSDITGLKLTRSMRKNYR